MRKGLRGNLFAGLLGLLMLLPLGLTQTAWTVLHPDAGLDGWGLSGAVTAEGAALTDYAENKIIDDLFRGTAYSPPATYYVGLMTSACSDSAAGTEVSGGSYARVGVSRADASFKGTHGSTTGVSSGTSGTISNAAAVTFPAPTANWGTVTHWGVWDASTAGNLIICDDLTTSKTINNGDAAPSFAIDALTIQIDN